ncbi:MAG: cation:proton antiporter, partial [bacterium]
QQFYFILHQTIINQSFLKSIKRSWGIAFFGALAPFVTAYSFALYYWSDTHIAIMCGLAMTATAVSLTMVSLKSEGLNKTHAATGIMTSAVLDDIASLVLVAMLVPMATGSAEISLAGTAIIVLKAIAFFTLIIILGGWIFPQKNHGFIKRIPFIGKHGLKNILKIGNGENIILSILLLAVSIAIIGHEFDFHPAVGAYMAGLILKEEFFKIDKKPKKSRYKATRSIIDDIAFGWIGPVFFVELGSKIIFDWSILSSVIPEGIALFFAIFIAQTISASVAAHYTGNFSWADSIMIGFGMLGRAELAFVVIDIAYVENQILSTEAFYTLMLTMFMLNISVPLSIKLWKPHFLSAKQVK